MKSFALNAVVSLLVVACGLLAYDRLVFRPSQVIGIVDVSDVYRAKEAEFASLAQSLQVKLGVAETLVGARGHGE